MHTLKENVYLVIAEDFKFVGNRRVDKESSDAIGNEQ